MAPEPPGRGSPSPPTSGRSAWSPSTARSTPSGWSCRATTADARGVPYACRPVRARRRPRLAARRRPSDRRDRRLPGRPGLARAAGRPPAAAVVPVGARQPRARDARRAVGVGRRRAQQHGLRRHRGERSGFGLAERGWTVVSGAAFGIDAAAHRGALSVDGADGRGGGRRGRPALPRWRTRRCWPRIARGRRGRRRGGARAWLRPGHGSCCATGSSPPCRAGSSSSRRRCGPARSTRLARPPRSADPVGVVPGPVTSMMSSGCHQARRDGLAEIVTDVDEVIDLVGDFGVDAAPRRSAEPFLADLLDPSDARVLASVPVRRAQTALDIAVRRGVPVDADGRRARTPGAAGLRATRRRGLAEGGGPGTADDAEERRSGRSRRGSQVGSRFDAARTAVVVRARAFVTVAVVTVPAAAARGALVDRHGSAPTPGRPRPLADAGVDGLVDEFVRYLRAERSRSEHTIRAYAGGRHPPRPAPGRALRRRGSTAREPCSRRLGRRRRTSRRRQRRRRRSGTRRGVGVGDVGRPAVLAVGAVGRRGGARDRSPGGRRRRGPSTGGRCVPGGSRATRRCGWWPRVAEVGCPRCCGRPRPPSCSTSPPSPPTTTTPSTSGTGRSSSCSTPAGSGWASWWPRTSTTST